MAPPRVFVTRRLPGTALDVLGQRTEMAVWEDELPPPREELLRQAARCEGLVTLLTDGREPRTVLARDIQLDPRSHTILHVDFYQVKEFEKITVEVPIHFVGEINTSLQAGTLVHPLSAIVVECLPQDMPRAIEVDVSTLEAFNKPLHVRELNLPPNVPILTNQEQVVATIEPPRVVEVEEAVAPAPEAEEKKPEEEKGKEEKAKKEGA